MEEEEIDERSPLLACNGDANGGSIKPNGSVTVASCVDGTSGRSSYGEDGEQQSHVEVREGMPELRKKMWMLIPAIGIGGEFGIMYTVFLLLLSSTSTMSSWIRGRIDFREF